MQTSGLVSHSVRGGQQGDCRHVEQQDHLNGGIRAGGHFVQVSMTIVALVVCNDSNETEEGPEGDNCPRQAPTICQRLPRTIPATHSPHKPRNQKPDQSNLRHIHLHISLLVYHHKKDHPRAMGGNGVTPF